MKKTRAQKAEKRAELLAQRDKLTFETHRETEKLKRRFQREWEDLWVARRTFPTDNLFQDAQQQLLISQQQRANEVSIRHRLEMLLLSHQAKGCFTPEPFAPPIPRVEIN